MILDSLLSNIKVEKKIILELMDFYSQIPESIESKNKRAEKIINNLIIQLKAINDSVPAILENMQFYKDLQDNEKTAKDLVSIKFSGVLTGDINIVLKKSDESRFMRAVLDYENLKKESAETIKTGGFFLEYVRLANIFFKGKAADLVEKGYFNPLKSDLKRITSPLLITTYAAITLFSLALSFFAAIILSLAVYFLNMGLGMAVLFFLGIPLLTFVIFYMYPSTKRKSLEKDINQELPFLTIYMSAIATSGIEPSKIFDILLFSKDYPATQREIKKLTNYLNFYGYDLVSAMKLVAKNNPSERFSGLLEGIATTITSGGELTNFLNKHSETLLFDYRLEREKYTHTAETFMNIYISIVIAAPMIMMMMFILLNLTGFGGSSTSSALIAAIIILIISFVNVGFLVFLNIKQPKF